MANKVVIDIEARLIDQVSKGAHAASKALDEMGKKADKQKKKLEQINRTNVKPKVGVDDSKFTKAMNKTQRLLKKLDGTKATAVLDAMDRATQKISSIHNRAKTFASNWKAKLGIDSGNSTRIIEKVTGGLKSIVGKTWRGTLKILDGATAPIRKISDALFSLKGLFMGVVGAMATHKLVIQPIQLADAYSSAKIGFSTLLGESAGQEMMNQLDEFAKKTPFKTSNVIANAQKMMAMGWDPETVVKDMEVIGNAAASTGKLDVGLESIVRALSQIKTKGRLSTEELNQLAEAGIAAKAMLAEGLGYGSGDSGIAKMTKDLEGGKIASDRAIEALLVGLQKYDGMMDSMANETVEGLKSQLEDAFEINIARRWGQGLQDGAKRGLGTVITLLDDADAALTEFGDTVYEIGQSIGNWAADKLENAVKRITEITGSYEFKNATLGEKISMLWNGVIVDPLGEWWENGGRDKTVETAGKIGKSMGEFLSGAIKGLLGITDIFEEGGIDESGGMSVAQSFAKGFVDGFDVSGVTDKLIEAISNVWNALPWWGKMLVGGYIGGKAIGIGSTIVGGLSKLAPFVGSTGNAMVSGTGISSLLAGLGYKLTGGAAGSALSGGMAAGTGLGAITAGVGLYHAGSTGLQAYRDFKAGDKTSGWANVARSGLTVAGIGGGALAGAKIGAAIGTVGGPAGTLIGAGLGTLVGWFAGDKIAKNIEAAKFEVKEYGDAWKKAESDAEKAEIMQKAIWETQKRHFGEMKLSLEEIERISNQIVYGDQRGKFDEMASAAKQAKASYTAMKEATADMDRWMWKANLGVKFNDDEKESFVKSVEEYINNAKAYVENKHYEFTASVSLLVDTEKGAGKGILDAGNDFYGQMKENLDKAGKELGEALSKALEDGIITADENKAIAAAQQKIADITNKISKAEVTAEMDLIKLKFGGAEITSESFEAMQSQLQTSIDERISKMDDAFTASVSSIRLQVEEGALSTEEAQKQIDELAKGYKAQIELLQAEVKGVQLEIVADAYSDILGENAIEKLNNALSTALSEGINPKTWTLEEAKRLLGVDSLSNETAGAIGLYLGSVADQVNSMNVDGKLNVNVAVETEKVNLTASDFGVESDYKYNPTVSVDPVQSVTKLSLGMGSFGLRAAYSYSPTVNVSPVFKGLDLFPNYLGGTFRGGIVGYSNGGVVKGGSKFIKVAEEGDPEMVIPLSQRRRDRAMSLWEQAGKILHADFGGSFATGGIVGGTESGVSINRETPVVSGGSSGGPQNVTIDVGGISLNVTVEGGQDAVEAIQAQKEQIAEEIASILNKAIAAQYQNMPATKGA